MLTCWQLGSLLPMGLLTMNIAAFEIGTLFSWATKHGALIGKAKATVNPVTGVRGITAQYFVDYKEALLEVPRSTIIVPSRSKVIDAGIPYNVYDKSSSNVRLALTLLTMTKNTHHKEHQKLLSPHAGLNKDPVVIEFDRMESSLVLPSNNPTNWHPYIDNLPTKHDFANVGIYWNEEELELLCCPSFATKARQQRVQRETLAEAMFKSGKVSHGYTKEEFHWALNCVESRALEGRFGNGGLVRILMAVYALTAATTLSAVTIPSFQAALFAGTSPINASDLASSFWIFALPLLMCTTALMHVGMKDEIALIPVVDLVNHSSTSPRSNLAYGIFSDRLRFSLHGKLQQGEEAHFNYGGLAGGINNDRLLMLYGFVETDNIHDQHALVVPDWHGENIKVIIGREGKIVRIPKGGEAFFTTTPSGNIVRNSDSDLMGINDDEVKDTVMTTVTGERILPSQLAAIIDAVYVELDSLELMNEQKSDASICTPNVTMIYSRCELAKAWRVEKIRLLREFTETHVLARSKQAS